MITVLRLGHRRGRDDRISTHVGLTARQFGADRIIYTGEKDDHMLDSLHDVADRWGGDFDIQYTKQWRKTLKAFDGLKVHLTMYGLPFQQHINTVRDTMDDMLIVVGAEKVPKEVYELVDHNLAVGSQPHSEVAALGVFLHDLLQGVELDRSFEDADIRVVPRKRGKKTVTE